MRLNSVAALNRRIVHPSQTDRKKNIMKKWTLKHYKRNTINGKWRIDSTEIRYISDDVAEKMFSDDELRFWRAIGTVRRHGAYSVTRINPDKLAKTEEIAEDISTFDMYHKGGIRERECLDLAYYDFNRCADINNCLKIGNDERFALWSFDKKQWVG